MPRGLNYVMELDSLWKGGPKYLQAPNVFPLSSDTAWLGAFVRLSGVKRFCDLGCGGGALSLQLLGRKGTLEAGGMDISAEAVAAARENLRMNGFAGEFVCCDLRDWKSHFRPGSYDLVVTNPPYFPDTGRKAAGARGDARTESCALPELCTAAASLIHEGGRFCIVFQPVRLSELCCAMTDAGIEPKRLQFVLKDTESEPSAILLEGIKGGGKGLRILPPKLTAEVAPCPENSI